MNRPVAELSVGTGIGNTPSTTARRPINYQYEKATASNTPNATPCFISDQPSLLTSRGSAFSNTHREPRTNAGTNAKIAKAGRKFESEARTSNTSSTD